MKVGFIGCGNMASAMIKGMVTSNIVKAEDIFAYDLVTSNVTKLSAELGIYEVESNVTLVESCDVVILAIKPHFYESVIAEIKQSISTQIILGIAPNYTIAMLEKAFTPTTKIIRCMPNTPAMVLEGMSGVCANDKVSKQELDSVCHILSSFSKCEVIDESMMEAVIAVSGSSPAYVYMMIEAMADAAVKQGLPRDKAYTFAAQAVYGSAKMVLDSGMHPAVLKDMVCSPRGTTIEAVQVLEEKGFRASLMDAMQACADKAKNM